MGNWELWLLSMVIKNFRQLTMVVSERLVPRMSSIVMRKWRHAHVGGYLTSHRSHASPATRPPLPPPGDLQSSQTLLAKAFFLRTTLRSWLFSITKIEGGGMPTAHGASLRRRDASRPFFFFFAGVPDNFRGRILLDVAGLAFFFF